MGWLLPKGRGSKGDFLGSLLPRGRGSNGDFVLFAFCWGDRFVFVKFTRGPLLPPMLTLDRVSFVTVEKCDTLTGVN